MRPKHIIIVLAIAVFLIASSLLVTATPAVEQIAGLSGTVTDLVTPGIIVREGDILVRVDTLTGPVPAARATMNGVVEEVLVKVGNSIKIGDSVARIKTDK